MFMSSRSCHEVVPGRYGEQIKDIRANTFQEINSFMGGEGGYRRARFGKLYNVAIIFRGWEEVWAAYGGVFWSF